MQVGHDLRSADNRYDFSPYMCLLRDLNFSLLYVVISICTYM